METLIPKYRYHPNEKVYSLFSGVSSGGRTVTAVVKASADRNRLEKTVTYGTGIPRGQGGRVAVLVLGGMETTLDEMQYILQSKQEKKFVPRRNGSDIAEMCRLLQARRNEQIEALRKYLVGNPSEIPQKKRTVRLHLPVGFRYVPTSEPGFRVLARI